MIGKKKLVNEEYTEKISKNCTLVVHPKNWRIEYNANTLEEDDDMKYKVTSDKIDQYLFDLKKNLQLYLNTKDGILGKKKDDREGLRDMIIRYKGEKPGVYLTDTFHIVSTEDDYIEVERSIEQARKIVSEIWEDIEKN